MDRVAFHNTGPMQYPGLIVMSIADDYGDVDLTNELVVVLINAADEPASFVFPAGDNEFSLHPVQAASVDPVVQTAYYDTTAETFEVPARTTAVFLAQRPVDEQIDVLLDLVDGLEADGVINSGQANALRAKLDAAQKSAASGRVGPAVNQINAFIYQVNALMTAGLLSPEDGERLISIAEEIVQSLSQ